MTGTVRPFGSRTRVSIKCGGKGRTDQSAKASCDINLILKRHARTGEPLPFDNASYGDFSNVDDYQTSCNKILAAQASFDALPSKVRTRMRNDPGELLVFMADPENLAEAIELGLVNKPKAEEPEGATSVPTPAPEGGDPPPSNPSPIEGGD